MHPGIHGSTTGPGKNYPSALFFLTSKNYFFFVLKQQQFQCQMDQQFLNSDNMYEYNLFLMGIGFFEDHTKGEKKVDRLSELC